MLVISSNKIMNCRYISCYTITRYLVSPFTHSVTPPKRALLGCIWTIKGTANGPYWPPLYRGWYVILWAVTGTLRNGGVLDPLHYGPHSVVHNSGDRIGHLVYNIGVKGTSGGANNRVLIGN